MSDIILVTIPFTETQKKKIADAAAPEKVTFLKASEITDEQLQNAEVIIGNVDPTVVSAAGKLKWMQLNSAGANQYIPKGILAEETVLTCASGAYAQSVTEAMISATMALYRKVTDYYDNQKKHLWKDEGDFQSPYGATVVVLGLGNIGCAYARIMKAMGSYVIGLNKHPGEKPDCVDELYTMEYFDECLKRADLVACILPGTAETKGMIGKKQLKAMKSTAYLLNFGRGNSVDSIALYEALKAGEIAGAALDVTDPEPLPADHILWDAPNILITPHCAGKFHIPVTLDNISDIVAANLKHYLKGEPLEHVVNRKLGY